MAYSDSAFYKNLKARLASETDLGKKDALQSQLDEIDKQAYQQEYGGMGKATLGDFGNLLSRLEASKIRQQQAKDISARPNIYAQGLAQMMSNF